MLRKLLIFILLLVFPIYVSKGKPYTQASNEKLSFTRQLTSLMVGLLSMIFNSKYSKRMLCVFVISLFLTLERTLICMIMQETRQKSQECGLVKQRTDGMKGYLDATEEKRGLFTDIACMKGFDHADAYNGFNLQDILRVVPNDISGKSEGKQRKANYGGKGKHPWYLDMANLEPENSTIEAYPFTLDRYFDEVLQNNPRSALMKYEWARFASFNNFPCDSPARPLRLAQSGFYYTGTADNVVCFSCNVEYGKWKDGDDTASIHKQINPNCGFVTGEDRSNIPIHDKSGPIGQNGSLPATRKEPGATAAPTSVVTDGAAVKTNPPLEVKQHCAFGAKDDVSYRTQGAKHPDFADVKKRSESFKDWPFEHIVSRQVLVASGFVYAGVGDCVRCFYCGLGLRNWEAGDGPWEEHARWSQRCKYVLEEMGLQFVRQHATETDEVPHHQSQVGTPAKPSAVNYPSTVGTPAKPNAVNYPSTVGTPAKPNAVKNPSTVGTPAKPTAVKQQPTDGTPAEQLIRNQPSADHRPHGKSSEQKLETNSIKEEKQESNASTKDAGFQKSLSETSTKDSKQIRDENVQLKSQLTCKVCMDRDTNTVVLPCGHFVSCDVCSRNLRKCVICRSKIQARVKAFMS